MPSLRGGDDAVAVVQYAATVASADAPVGAVSGGSAGHHESTGAMATAGLGVGAWV